MDNTIIEQYSHLIYKLAHSFKGYPNKEDLYQVGYKGLIQAYKNFNSNAGSKFSTYAYKYIWGEMQKLVREDYGMKVSRDLRRLKSQIENSRVILAQQLMRQPTDEEIFTYLGVDALDFKEAVESSIGIQSLDQPIANEGREFTLYDTVASMDLDMDTRLAFKQELERLTPIERSIIEDRYLKNLSQQEVASLYGMTQVQVSREEKKIKTKIRSHMDMAA